MHLLLRLVAMIAGAVVGGALARLLAADLTLVGMVVGAMVGWLVSGEPVARWLRKNRPS
jgi:hypothetical protein